MDFEKKIFERDVSLFDKIPSQTLSEDQHSLLAIQNATALDHIDVNRHRIRITRLKGGISTEYPLPRPPGCQGGCKFISILTA